MLDLNSKRCLVDLTSSQGWLIATNIAKSKLEEMERQALDCEDDTEVAGLAREARAARKFWHSFLSTLSNAKSPEETPADSFIQVSY